MNYLHIKKIKHETFSNRKILTKNKKYISILSQKISKLRDSKLSTPVTGVSEFK